MVVMGNSIKRERWMVGSSNENYGKCSVMFLANGRRGNMVSMMIGARKGDTLWPFMWSLVLTMRG